MCLFIYTLCSQCKREKSKRYFPLRQCDVPRARAFTKWAESERTSRPTEDEIQAEVLRLVSLNPYCEGDRKKDRSIQEDKRCIECLIEEYWPIINQVKAHTQSLTTSMSSPLQDPQSLIQREASLDKFETLIRKHKNDLISVGESMVEFMEQQRYWNSKTSNNNSKTRYTITYPPS